MAKRRGRPSVNRAEQPTTVETTIVGFAKDLGRFLGTAERRANEWFQQRQVLTTQLEKIRDTATRYLGQLGNAPVAALRRRGRPSASARTSTPPVTATGGVAPSAPA